MPTTTKVWAGGQTNDGAWTNPGNTTGVADTVVAITNGSGTGVKWIQPDTFGTFAAIPAGSTLNSITLTVVLYNTTAARWDTERVQCYIGGSPVGAATTLAENTTLTSQDVVLRFAL